MFHNTPDSVRAIMEDLERRDGLERDDGTPRPERLGHITPDTGNFIVL